MLAPAKERKKKNREFLAFYEMQNADNPIPLPKRSTMSERIKWANEKNEFHEFLAYFLNFVNRTTQLDPIIYIYLNNESY